MSPAVFPIIHFNYVALGVCNSSRWHWLVLPNLKTFACTGKPPSKLLQVSRAVSKILELDCIFPELSLSTVQQPRQRTTSARDRYGNPSVVDAYWPSALNFGQSNLLLHS